MAWLKWKVVAERLRRDIQQELVGPKLPPEQELADRYDVNRHTLRRAVKSLQEEDIVRVRRGIGTFVKKVPLSQTTTISGGYTKNIADLPNNLTRKVVSMENIKPDRKLRKRLGNPTVKEIIKAELENRIDGQLAAYSVHYFNLKKTNPKQLRELFEKNAKIKDALGEIGITGYNRRKSNVTVRKPSRHEAKRIGSTEQIFFREYTGFDEEENVIEYAEVNTLLWAVEYLSAP